MVTCCFVWKDDPKNAGFQWSTLSIHCMTGKGIGTFELPTCGLLQREWYQSSPKACFLFEKPSSRFAVTVL